MYNGKEFNEDLGLDWYAYGFRYYDPAIGRFTGVDPIADQFPELSVFNYASNDPISMVDLHGLQGEKFDILRQTTDNMNITPEQLEEYKKGERVAAEIIAETVTEMAAGATPAGVVIDVGDFTEAAVEGDKVGMVLSGIGFLPVLGDALKGVGKGVRRLLGLGNKWKGPVDYSDIIDANAASRGEGKPFTKRQKSNVLEHNKKANDGLLRSDKDGTILNTPKQSKKGVRADMNQGEVDHVIPKAKKGTNEYGNSQVLSKKQNIEKSDS